MNIYPFYTISTPKIYDMVQLNPTTNQFTFQPPRIHRLQQQQQKSMYGATFHNEACKHKQKNQTLVMMSTHKACVYK